MIFTNFYALAIFLPIIIIFSVQGLIYIKKFISRISKKLDWVFPILFLSIVLGFFIPNYGIYSDVVLWNVFLILFVSLILFLFVFLTINYNNLIFSRTSFDSHKLKKGIWIIAFTMSFLAFSEIGIEAGRDDINSSPFPWENRYLTNEEIEIIEYFQNEDIDGLIFCAAGRYISGRIRGIGFLPVFSESTLIGIPLFYGLISPNYVHENTKFNFSELFRFGLFTFNETDPITELLNAIKALDVGKGEDFHTLVLYNVQYIITINNTFQPGGINNWPLIRSLQQSELFEPVFSTLHLLVWKIY
jgi:Ca2+/Na+ antiporter